ncbi:MAG: N-acetyltransferase family protein [Pyrinomonadaceae bacterium]
MNYLIDDMRPTDWDEVRLIYLEGIASGHATFETEAPAWDEWNAGHLSQGRLVARGVEGVEGWAALSPVSGRCVYAGVAEVSVYVGQAHRAKGMGRALLEALISASERAGVWTLQAGVFPENAASVRLHRLCGFREVGRRVRIGKMNGIWRDTLLLERRSSVVETD